MSGGHVGCWSEGTSGLVEGRAFTHMGVYGTMNSTAQEGGSNNGLK
jgi:hypothetical protein